jgi:hypothetical protein
VGLTQSCVLIVCKGETAFVSDCINSLLDRKMQIQETVSLAS